MRACCLCGCGGCAASPIHCSVSFRPSGQGQDHAGWLEELGAPATPSGRSSPAVLKLAFDNTYSYFTAKRVEVRLKKERPVRDCLRVMATRGVLAPSEAAQLVFCRRVAWDIRGPGRGGPSLAVLLRPAATARGRRGQPPRPERPCASGGLLGAEAEWARGTGRWGAEALSTAGDKLVQKSAELQGSKAAAAAAAGPQPFRATCPKCGSLNELAFSGAATVQCGRCGQQFQCQAPAAGGASLAAAAPAGVGTSRGSSASAGLAGAAAAGAAALGAAAAAKFAESKAANQVVDKVLGKVVDSAASKFTGGLVKEVPTEAKSMGVEYLKKNPETAVKVAKMAMKCRDRVVLDGPEAKQAQGWAGFIAIRRLSFSDQASGRWERAVALLGRMRAVRLPADTQCHNAALGACRTAGRWREALSLLAAMRSSGPAADARSYEAAVAACEAAGQAEQALDLIKEMSAAVPQAQPAAARAREEDLEWLRMMLNEAMERCPEGEVGEDLRGHLTAAMGSLQRCSQSSRAG
ncbi:unnamed protein product [Prorocentrum cordatum]|uniref:Uncharacterized protein n=1 Tax=Prorocentrum cordatum TaxID=2364126 RepID=A0ABN9W3L7_9DINO|nr:unnamed protein product [Polarella glacialis]